MNFVQRTMQYVYIFFCMWISVSTSLDAHEISDFQQSPTDHWVYAPWRSRYVGALKDNSGIVSTQPKKCVFCADIARNEDEKMFIIKRFSHCCIMLNLFPYTHGHLLVVPFVHGGDLEELPSEVRAQMMEVTAACCRVLKKFFKCPGLNVGFNLGRCAGASVPDHVHMHIMPRAEGDMSFVNTLAKTYVMSADLPTLYATMITYFNEIVL